MLPCSSTCTQDQILKLANMRIARAIMVRDPHGYCSDLLKKSIDAYDIQLVLKHMIKVIRSRSYDEDIVVLDVRKLPKRPIKPWSRLRNALYRFTAVTRSSVILYTDSEHRWIDIDGVSILCVGESS